MSEARTQTWKVRTPEGVAFSFRLASPVLRMLAAAVDWMVVSAAWSVLSIVFQLLNIISRDWAAMIAVIAYFVLSQGYRIATEWVWRGQSVGKRMLRLRVVDARGLRLTFGQVVMRNLLRFVDSLPVAYLVGGVATLLNKRAQRLGDLAAGTLVVWEPVEALPPPDVLQSAKYNSLRAHSGAVARLRQLSSPEVARAAWQALVRRDKFSDAARVELFAELADYFRALTPLPDDAVGGISDEQLVRNVIDVLFVNRV